LTACGDEPAKPAATVAPSTTPPATAPATTPAGPTRDDVVASLRSAAIAAEAYYTDASVYPPDTARLREAGFEPEPGVTVDILSPGKTYYCLKGTGGGLTLYFASDVGKVSEKPCS
jgi:hypothetical protein